RRGSKGRDDFGPKRELRSDPSRRRSENAVLCYYGVIIMYDRTTIVLPRRLKEIAVDRAAKEGISFSEFVRRAVEHSAAGPPPRARKKADPFLADRAVYRGETPKDLVPRHDDYLFEEDDS